MTDLASYASQLEGFRSSDEARERLVSVRSLLHVRNASFPGLLLNSHRTSSKNSGLYQKSMLI